MSVDKIKRGFQLINKITLKVKDVHLIADYTVTGAKDNNGAANFGSHIKIKFLLESYSNGGL
ncbi:hypothetical protein CN326_03745 [Bacillus sp. AFS018417]|nr:hypothetical protein CN326_03745 [Bacillus sp. AFS018417]